MNIDLWRVSPASDSGTDYNVLADRPGNPNTIIMQTSDRSQAQMVVDYNNARVRAMHSLIKAWETLPQGFYSTMRIQSFLDNLAPCIQMLRDQTTSGYDKTVRKP